MNVNESAKIKKNFSKFRIWCYRRNRQCRCSFLNTCTVREGAATQIFGKLGELKALKEKRGTIIGVTGCFAQRTRWRACKKIPNNRYSYGKSKYRKNTSSDRKNRK